MARNWPVVYVVADFTAGPPAPPSRSSVSLSTPPLTVRSVHTTRGRQYELGFVQAGTCSLDVVDTPEYLNPANASSPFNTGSNSVLPYRCVQVGAYWNAATRDTTGNIFNSANKPAYATNANLNAYDPSFETSLGALASVGATAALSTAQKFDGAQSAAVTFTATTDYAQITAPFLNPGSPVTFSSYVYVPAGTTLNLAMINAGGGIGATIASAASTVSGAWQRLVVTGAPSTPAVVMRFTVTGTAAATVYLDAMQLEFGSAASAFTTSGPANRPIYTGYVERYPSKWDSAGFRGLRPLEAVDALSVLSRTVISQSYAATIAPDGPQVYIPYNDAAPPLVAQRPTGGQPMIGFTQLGSNSGAVNFGGDTFLDGSKAVSLVQQNANPVTFGDNSQITWLGTRQGGLTMNPQSFTWECWVKATSGVFFFGAGSMAPGESTINSFTPAIHVALRINAGSMAWEYKDGAGVLQANVGVPGPKVFPDGQWHYMCLTFVGNNGFIATTDSIVGGTATFASTPPASSFDNMFVTSDTNFGDPISNVSVANVAIYAKPLSNAQKLSHYNRGSGYLGELSGDRIARLLTQYWGPSSTFDANKGRVKMSADFAYNGRQLLSVLQDITDTEGGLLWAGTDGVVVAVDRDYRYILSTSSMYTFGENAAAGELPYADVEYDYDPTYVYSEADLTAASGALYKAVNSTSQAAYGQRILSKTMYMANDWDVGQSAQFYAQRYAKPPGAPGSNTAPRISKFTIEPGFNPALFDAALRTGIGSRITVKRRTSAGVVISGDYYVEQVSHKINADTSTWSVDYQLSPVFNPTAWKLGDATNGVLGTTSVCVY